MPNLIESNVRWQHRSACIDTPLDYFFETYEKNAIIAKRQDMVCKECPVKQQCMSWAVNNQATGLHAEVYMVLGKYAKNKNRHKTPEDSIRLNEALDQASKRLGK